LLLAGRGFGKTRAAAEAVRALVCGPTPLAGTEYAHIAKLVRVPEVDRAEWFALEDARDKIIKSQTVFLDRLETLHETRVHIGERDLTANGTLLRHWDLV
jgi:hypothetical protein